ncbi:MAG: carboxynorspermidine decarboxylase [Kiritimatiellae bacterium]|nr:carboxynorspermidine decarboxylase [Kiritimatiellia bacterium]
MPRYVIDEAALLRNLEILKSVSERTGVRILLAQKAFSCTAVYPLCAKYLSGTTASSLFEAKHGHDNFGGETHVFAPAFIPEEMDELLGLVDHIVFNSPRQVALYGEMARKRGVSVGLRVNPEVSVATTPAYDPCRPSSRLGTTRAVLGDEKQLGVDGLHFHCLCEQGLDELKKVLAGFEERFGEFLPQMKWVNFGGGHHITREGYDVDGLVALLNDFKARHPHLVVYLEPGEAIALNAGTLESRVLEIQPKGTDGISNAILDTSAACHMPDVIEMPYTPPVVGGVIYRDSHQAPSTRHQAPGTYLYRFGGPTCLAGDEIGVYSFKHELREGDIVVFGDMAIYTMVKNNTFNGVNLPDIVVRHVDGSEELVRKFGYDDFACRL